MKLDNPNRQELSRIPYLSDALDWILSAISATFNVEHHDDGTHGAITCDSISVRAIPTDAASDVQTDGNITGSLIPTTATQDLGGLITIASSGQLQRPWRDVYLSGNVTWTTFGVGAVSGAPAIVRSGGNITWTNGGTFTVVGNNSSTPCTLTVASAVASSADLAATNDVTAGANLVGQQCHITDGVTAPSATSGKAKIYVDTADGDLKVIFGDGTIKLIVAD